MSVQAIRIKGRVQGVGFRPMVWTVAHQLNLTGQVFNDHLGVLIYLWADQQQLAGFIAQVKKQLPPLASIDTIDVSLLTDPPEQPDTFSIVPSHSGDINTQVVADAATCPQCRAEIFDPANRRYRYPFTNCTHCGPRLSIIHSMPYDRENTSMAAFKMCAQCEAEYRNPADRRFHAQPNACPQCGPKVWLEDTQGVPVDVQPDYTDAVEQAAVLIRQGFIVAIKGIGGFHLACDAGNHQAVSALRQRKYRYQKPLALMAKDLAMVKDYVQVNPLEQQLLNEHSAPIVILEQNPAMGDKALSDALAPGQSTLGFVLPYTPLHYLLMQNMTRPIVLTSANLSDEPQLIDNQQVREKLTTIADFFLLHDRDIVNRVDDSVIRVMDNQARFLRLARGYSPVHLKLPEGFPRHEQILAMGGELKNTFCLLKNRTLILSQYIGDLENAPTFKDYQHNLELYFKLYNFQADRIVVDKHPDYLSTQYGQQLGGKAVYGISQVQHHHAHIASCMLEHGLALNSEPVLGIALDGLGLGEDGSIWGGEFLLVNYQNSQRLASFQPVPMPGGTQAIKEPWRNTLAHLLANQLWDSFVAQYAKLEIMRFLMGQPIHNLQIMLEKGLNSPNASSAGRLFDALAAALGICTQYASYEGQAAIELEALASLRFEQEFDNAYPVDYRQSQIIWKPMWQAVFKDLNQQVPIAVIAARFHQCVVQAVIQVALKLTKQYQLDTIALSGGVFQNKLLLEGVSNGLKAHNLQVISPVHLPLNDGGIAPGQIAVALAKQTAWKLHKSI